MPVDMWASKLVVLLTALFLAVLCDEENNSIVKPDGNREALSNII